MLKKIKTPYLAVLVVAAVLDSGAMAATGETPTAGNPAAAASTLEGRLKKMEAVWKQMEAERQQMEAEMQSLRSEVARLKAETKSEVKAAEDKMTARQAVAEKEREAKAKERNHMVFFRGGHPQMADSRQNQLYTDLYGVDNGPQYGIRNSETDGVYFGAGVDLSISPDLFGLWDRTELMVEFNFDWNRWDSHQGGINAVGVNGAATAGPNTAKRVGLNPADRNLRGVTLSQFTISASPKIKFRRGSSFRPWLIPAGMSFNILSPPSDSTTFLGPGIMFGAGFDYNVWENFFLGMDFRYNWVANEMDDVKAAYYQLGGFIGLGF
jgi:opacity protein-like surface antigen